MVTKKLIKLAKLSPKEYAEIIRDRNQKLLDQLEKWYKGIQDGKHLSLSTEFTVEVGCPHCCWDGWFECHKCLLSDYGELEAFACCAIPFNGIQMNEQRGAIFEVSYCFDKASLFCEYDDTNTMEEVDDSYKEAKDFLEGHIEWASLDCWGEEYEGEEK